MYFFWRITDRNITVSRFLLDAKLSDESPEFYSMKCRFLSSSAVMHLQAMTTSAYKEVVSCFVASTLIFLTH